MACRHGVLFPSAACGAYWPIAIRCLSLGPVPSIGGGAHRPLTTLCLSPLVLSFPLYFPFLSLRRLCQPAPGLPLSYRPVSGPHGGGQLTWFLRAPTCCSPGSQAGAAWAGTLSPLIIACPPELLCASQGTSPPLLSAPSAPPLSCQENYPADAHPSALKSVLESTNPRMDSEGAIWMHLVNGTGNSPSSGTADPRSSQAGQVIRGLR